jgi:hypothetical protein
VKKHLTNDECVPYIRRREDFANKRGSLTGKTHEPGTYTPTGNLPEQYHGIVQEAEFIVYSYTTPIAWFGPLPLLTPEAVEEFIDGPGLDDLEAFLTGAVDLPRQRAFPCGGESQWQMPAVRYSRTTSVHHQGAMWTALRYEKTWREAEDGKSVESPLYAQTEYATTGYNQFQKRPSGTGRQGW